MKDLMKRLLCVLMALMMVMALVACGESDDDDNDRGSKRGNKETAGETTEETTTEPTEPELTLVGEWETEIDMTEYFNEMMGEEMGMDDLVDEFTMKLVFEFNEDGTCVMTIDKDHMEDMINDMIDNLWDVMMEMTAEQAGMTIEEVETLMEESGMTKDALLEEMDLESAFEDLEDMEGYWLLDGDELYIDEYDAEDADPIEIEFDDNDSFSMVGGKGMDMDGMEDYVLPLVFERV